ncbi:hypothetical protein BC831DRAFT_444550 [Entophlyctis helioformis]|nr:hypothetical protein BC831DRAFT_444550 [Entophlyctis helioformis]
MHRLPRSRCRCKCRCRCNYSNSNSSSSSSSRCSRCRCRCNTNSRLRDCRCLECRPPVQSLQHSRPTPCTSPASLPTHPKQQLQALRPRPSPTSKQTRARHLLVVGLVATAQPPQHRQHRLHRLNHQPQHRHLSTTACHAKPVASPWSERLRRLTRSPAPPRHQPHCQATNRRPLAQSQRRSQT